MLKSRIFGACVLLTLTTIVLAQTSDTTPPTLVEFDFDPLTIDVTSTAQLVNVTARVTDDLSGPGALYVYFYSPSAGQSHYAYIPQTQVSALESIYSGPVEIPPYVEPGTWTVLVYLYDSVGNYVSLNSANLAALGFPSELNVSSIPDTTPPSISSALFSPTVIDVSAGDQVVTLDLHLTDDVSGIDFDGTPNYYVGYLSSPFFGQRYAVPFRDFTFVSGSDLDATWRLMWTIPQHSEAGTWLLRTSLRDNAGNTAFVSDAGMFDVVSATPDLAPPVLTGLRFSPLLIDTSAGPAYVSVSMDLTDDLTGIDFSFASPNGGYFHGILFRSPSTSQSRSAGGGGFTMTSGTVTDGTWEAQVYFPQYSEAGTWQAWISNVTDHVRNSIYMSPAQLMSASLPTDLVVVRPSLEGDGLIDASGGTIVDETFPDRAQVTFPPNLVTGATDVAIDVFPDPLAVPTPVGFQGPGTFFVNIALTPEPAYPFPQPGVSVTLPLTDFINPGTLIPLYYVNPLTGILVPMASTSIGAGGSATQVIGVVNADGLSATFNGISHFSILVGLIPDTPAEDGGKDSKKDSKKKSKKGSKKDSKKSTKSNR